MKKILIAAIAFLLVPGSGLASDAVPGSEQDMYPYESRQNTDRFMEEYFPNDYQDRLREEDNRFSRLDNDRDYIDRDYYEPDYYPDSGFDNDYGFGYDYDYYDQDSFDYGYDDGNDYFGSDLNE